MGNVPTGKKEREGKFKYFDDCPVCQAMKKADDEGRLLPGKELLAAFQRAKKLRK